MYWVINQQKKTYQKQKDNGRQRRSPSPSAPRSSWSSSSTESPTSWKPTSFTESPTSSKPTSSFNTNAPQVPPALEALHQSTPHVPLLNWSHFNSNILESQMKTQKLTYLGQMTGLTHMDFWTTLRYKDLILFDFSMGS